MEKEIEKIEDFQNIREAETALENIIKVHNVVESPTVIAARYSRRRGRMFVSILGASFIAIGVAFFAVNYAKIFFNGSNFTSIYDITGFDSEDFISSTVGFGIFSAFALFALYANHFLAGDFRANWQVERDVWHVFRSVRRLQKVQISQSTFSATHDDPISPGQTSSTMFENAPPKVYPSGNEPLVTASSLAYSLHESMRSRLGVAVERLQGSARLNLLFGLLSALLGLGFLMWLAFEARSAVAEAIQGEIEFSAQANWFNWAVRLSVSITTQVLAFFFLSTYRRNLTEIKYFENELTTLETRFSALFLALSRADRDDSTISKILLTLANTERNFVLRRGETTANIRQLDQDLAQFETVVDMLGKLHTHTASQQKGN